MNEDQIKTISEKVKESGVISVNNLLNSEQFNSANNILKYIYDDRTKKGDNQGYFPIILKSIIIKLIKFEFDKIKKSFLLKKIAKELQFKKIAEKFFDSEAKLEAIDSYHNEKSDKFIIEWHNDLGYEHWKKIEDLNTDRRGVKFFIHMTDVESENGCLGYIPYSHHIVRATTSLILEKKIDLKAYWKLEDLRSLVSENPVKDLIIDRVGSEKLNIFLNNSKFIDEGTKDTFEFDNEMEKGGAVIFDEIGVHRGSMPKKNNRLVLRYLYRKKISSL